MRCTNSLLQVSYLATLILSGLSYQVAGEVGSTSRQSAVTTVTSQSTGMSSVSVIGKGFLRKTEIVSVNAVMVDKATRAKGAMQKAEVSQERAPQTIQDAAMFLSRKVGMACPPTKCFEHEEIFYFSGGTKATPVDDFSSGFAIRKGEAAIYQWSDVSTSVTIPVKK